MPVPVSLAKRNVFFSPFLVRGVADYQNLPNRTPGGEGGGGGGGSHTILRDLKQILSYKTLDAKFTLFGQEGI